MKILLRHALIDFFPSESGVAGIAEADLDAFLERYRKEAALTLRFGVAAAAWLYALSPLFTVGRPVLAAWLSPELRDRHADRLSRSPIYLVRQAMFLMKTVGGLCWGAHHEVRSAIGLPAYVDVKNEWRTS